MYSHSRGLRSDFPAPVDVGRVIYPTVEHAYWALSTADPAAHDLVRQAESVREARATAERAARREGWATARVAVMASLLRAKFTQHPELADLLLETRDARLLYGSSGSSFWQSGGADGGRNWMGRLLELVRSELAAQRSGLPS